MNRNALAMLRSGYTLIEILVVLLIVSVLAAGAVNLFSGGRFEVVDAAVRLVRSDLEYARAASLGSPTDPIILRIASDGSGYHLAKLSAPNTPLVGPLGSLTTTFGIGRADSATGIQLSTLSGATTVQFGPFGGIVDPVPTLRFTLLDGEERATMILDPNTGDPTVLYENE
jgi:prepilin-type N-terminal cleavage/methylation domain-containing protein